MSNATIDTDALLWDLNNEKARLFSPVFVYIGILLLTGTIGNAMVLYYYGYKHKITASTCFIIALAVFDLISCLVAMPMEIADLRFYFNFKNLVACKTLRFVSHFASISSGLTLVIIAVDRYRRICHPFDRQLNITHVKIICVLVGFFSAVLSWPAIVFNKIVDLEVPNSQNVHLIGHDCTTTKDDSLKTYIFVTNIVYVVAFVLITAVLSIIYTFIGRQLFRHQKFRYYVATKGATKTSRTAVTSSLLPASSNNATSESRDKVTVSDRVFEDPPDATGSVVDMKEFVGRGLTQVESDRPTTANTGVTGSTIVTGITGVSGKTKRSIKSVTICEPSDKDMYTMDTVDGSSEQENEQRGTWSINRQRVTSASSFATFSSRPSSAALSEYSDMDTVGRRGESELDRELGIITDTGKLNEVRRWREMTYITEEPEELNSPSFAENENEEGSINGMNENVAGSKGGSMRNTPEFMDANELPEDKNSYRSVSRQSLSRQEGKEDMISYRSVSRQSLSRQENKQSQSVVDHEASITIEQHNKSRPASRENSIDIVDRVVDASKLENRTRPSSKSSNTSRVSSISSRLRRGNTVSPAPSSQVTMTTTTTSLASRASSMRRLQSLLRYNTKSGKMETNTDNVKDLRMKMLDLNTMKYTVIMLIITIVFVLSFLPYLALVGWRYFKDQHEVNIFNDLELVLFQIGVRSIFLNSSLNPIIYGGFNSSFRAFFYGLFCKCCLRKRRKKRKRRAKDQSDSTSGT